MSHKWYAYWAALATAMFGVSLWRNWRKYKGRSKKFIFVKAAVDALFVGALAAFCPPLLIAYCVLQLAKYVKGDAIWKTTFSVVAGMTLSAVGGWFVELVLVVGLFAADLVTGRFLHHWNANAQPSRS